MCVEPLFSSENRVQNGYEVDRTTCCLRFGFAVRVWAHALATPAALICISQVSHGARRSPICGTLDAGAGPAWHHRRPVERNITKPATDVGADRNSRSRHVCYSYALPCHCPFRCGRRRRCFCCCHCLCPYTHACTPPMSGGDGLPPSSSGIAGGLRRPVNNIRGKPLILTVACATWGKPR